MGAAARGNAKTDDSVGCCGNAPRRFALMCPAKRTKDVEGRVRSLLITWRFE
jgi:hypothetical protein